MAEASWIRSSYCDSAGLACVEVLRSPSVPAVWVRDAKAPQEPAIPVAPQAWAAFVGGVVLLSGPVLRAARWPGWGAGALAVG